METKKEYLTSPNNVPGGAGHTLPSSERMNPNIDPKDPLGMVNYCLYGYSNAVPIFFTRFERQRIEDFLRDKSAPSFTLQSGEILSREKIQEYLNTYEHSIYRSAALQKIFFILEESAEKLNDEHKKELEEKMSELSFAYKNELKQQEMEHTPLLREAIEEFLSQHPNSPAKEELQQAINQYDEQYVGGISSENVAKAARILLNVIEALDDKDTTIAMFKDKAIQISYNMNSPETIQKVRNVLMLAQHLLKKEGFT